MKILYLADINSPLVLNLINNLKKANPKWEIDILSNSELKYSIDTSSFSNIYTINQNHFLSKIPILKMFWYSFLLNKELINIEKKYDYIHMLFVHVSYWCLINKIKAKCNKFIITVFGSDYYKSPVIVKKMISFIVQKTDLITATNEKTLSEFSTYYSVSEKNKSIVRFGLEALENIKSEYLIPQINHKNHFNIGNELVITCGYNGSKNQNHLPIIEQIAKIKNNLPPFVLLFPISTGINENYLNEIKQKLEQYNLKHYFITNYLTNLEVAKLRLATDIMIQVQNTDQLSGSMQEHLFAKNKVITAEWLPYAIFDNLGIRYFKIKSLDNLAETILNAVNSSEIDYTENQQIIWELSSWETCITNWVNLYYTK
jgi:hypothetical protein